MARMTRGKMPRMEGTLPAQLRNFYISEYVSESNSANPNPQKLNFLRQQIDGTGKTWDSTYKTYKKFTVGRTPVDNIDVGKSVQNYKNNPPTYRPRQDVRIDNGRIPFWMHPISPAAMTAFAMAKDYAINGDTSAARQFINDGVGLVLTPLASVAQTSIDMSNALSDGIDNIRDFVSSQRAQDEENRKLEQEYLNKKFEQEYMYDDY